MKKIKFYVAATFAALAMMMSSCMSDGDNIDRFSMYGVIESQTITLENGSKTSANVFYFLPQYAPLYSSVFQGSDYLFNTPSFVGAYCEINWDSPENANYATKGYATGNASILVNIDGIQVESLYETPSQSEETEYIMSGLQYLHWVKNTLFISTAIPQVPKDSKISYKVGLNPDQEPTQQTASEEKINVYDVYIRAYVTGSSSSTTATDGHELALPFYNNYSSGGYNNYYSSAYAAIYSKERGNNYIGLRINYAKSFDKETGKIEWAALSYGSLDFIPVYIKEE